MTLITSVARLLCCLPTKPALLAVLCWSFSPVVYAVAPQILSHNGLAAAIIATPENQLSVMTLQATDANGGALTFSLGGGDDQSLFTLDTASGELSFKTPPDFEHPADANKDNQYEVVVSVKNAQNESSTQALSLMVSDDKLVQFQARAWLQGAYKYTEQRMRNALQLAGLIPVQQPYRQKPFRYYGTETLGEVVLNATGDDAMVDWLLLELRDPTEPGTVLHSKAVVLQRDGDVVDAASGSRTLQFNLEQSDYVVGLRHRNHLAVMTAQALILNDTLVNVDFTDAQLAVAGDNSRATVGDQQLLWAGDIQNDKRIIAHGPGSDTNSVMEGVLLDAGNSHYNANFRLRGYSHLDLNLDGHIVFSGPDNDPNLLYASTLLHPGNQGMAANYIVEGHLADAPAVLPVTSDQEAARFLMQATFGPTLASIAELRALNSYAAWIDQQLTLPATRHYPAHQAFLAATGLAFPNTNQFQAIWRDQTLYAPDQLRQRMANALGQIMVVSARGNGFSTLKSALANYHDLLAEHAFGNFRDLLEAVTLSPVMGRYLNMLNNRKANPTTHIHPDENYAREIMQLFTVGLHRLNPDGTPELDATGALIPTYTQDDIEGLAAVLTGWTYHGVTTFANPKNFLDPMQGWPGQHQTGAKTIIDGHIIQAPTMEAELKQALDVLFNHPNVPPFIGRQLIQRFVTSHPTPAYVERVSQVFADNGKGVRGDLGAVLKAILLDPEARFGHRTLPDQFGKVKEPLIRQMALWRALGGQRAANPTYDFRANGLLGQSAYDAPTVFNFYRPDFQPQGELQTAALDAPEMQILTEEQLTRARNYIRRGVEQLNGLPDDFPAEVVVNFDHEDLQSDPVALLEHYNLLLMAGGMPQSMKNVLLRYWANSSQTDLKKREARFVFMIMGSSQQSIQR